MGHIRPYFKNGKLVSQTPITRSEAAQLQKAESWTAVESSNVGFICWRPDEDGSGRKCGLGVWFAPRDKSGRIVGKQTTYWYPTAPYELFKSMLAADSKGKFLNEKVIPNHPHDGPYPAGG